MVQFKTDKRALFTIITLPNPLNQEVVTSLKTLIQQMINDGVKNLVLDVISVEIIQESSGLSAFVFSNRICKENGGTCVLLSPTIPIRRLIKISQLEPILNISNNINEAVEHIRIAAD